MEYSYVLASYLYMLRQNMIKAVTQCRYMYMDTIA